MYRMERASSEALKKWLSGVASYDVYATVTLKQALLNEAGSLTPLTRDECERTARILRDRAMKAVLGTARWRRGESFPFVPSLEGGDGVTRFHLHIAMKRPSDIAFPIFETRFVGAARKLDWVHNQIDVREVVCDRHSSSRVIGYSLKEGLEAFLPGAATI